MTRDEAERIYIDSWAGPKAGANASGCMITMLERLGVLKLDDPDEKDLREAGRAIESIYVGIKPTSSSHCGQLTVGGAYEVLDALRNRGFKVVRK